MIPIIPVNVDTNLVPKFFAGATFLYVSSWFRTIQGEGPLAGYPAVFIRLAGCNFGAKNAMCQFCDTSFQIDRAHHMSPAELAATVLSIPGIKPTDALVITGGEPMMQPLILDALEVLSRHFSTIQFETNGTQDQILEDLVSRSFNMSTQIVVSPKASNKAKKYAPLRPKMAARLDCLKFVLSADADNPHHTIPKWAFDLRESRGITIYGSPMTIYKKAPETEVASIWDADLIDHEATARNYSYAAAYVMEHGITLSLQTHLFTAVP